MECYGTHILVVLSPEHCLIGSKSWTLVYDTEYACQDWKDDAKAGVKSTALLFGKCVREVLMAFATIFVVSLVVAGYINQQGKVYYLVTCGGTALHFTWQFYTWNVDDAADCGSKFKVSYVLELVLEIAINYDVF